MERNILILLLAACLSFGVTLNYSKKIIETGRIQMEKAKEITEIYNERIKYLDLILDDKEKK